jgi:uncharacterized protein
MVCPVDGERLAISSRGRIEIDYCPTCRGVWLDRGELDKIIEDSETSDNSYKAPKYEQDTRSQQTHHKKKRESFLGDLFDF